MSRSIYLKLDNLEPTPYRVQTDSMVGYDDLESGEMFRLSIERGQNYEVIILPLPALVEIGKMGKRASRQMDQQQFLKPDMGWKGGKFVDPPLDSGEENNEP